MSWPHNWVFWRRAALLATVACVACAACSNEESPVDRSSREISERFAEQQGDGGTREQRLVAAIRTSGLDTTTWLDTELIDSGQAACNVLDKSHGDFTVIGGLNPPPPGIRDLQIPGMTEADFAVFSKAQFLGIEILCPKYRGGRDDYLSSRPS